MDIIRKKSKAKLAAQILAVPVAILILGLFPYAIFNHSTKKPAPTYGSGFMLREREAQVFQVQLSDNMLLEYKLTPRFDFEGKIQYSTDLTLFYWNSELERYTPYPATVPPQEIINELNKFPVKPFTHEVK